MLVCWVSNGDVVREFALDLVGFKYRKYLYLLEDYIEGYWGVGD